MTGEKSKFENKKEPRGEDRTSKVIAWEVENKF